MSFLVDTVIWVIVFFSSITLSMSWHSLLAWTFSTERSAIILMGIPLCVICCFSLFAFNICSLCLIFVNLINMCLGCFTLGLSCLRLSGFLGLSWLFLPHFREVFNYYLLKHFLMVFLFVSLDQFVDFIFFNSCIKKQKEGNFIKISVKLAIFWSLDSLYPVYHFFNLISLYYVRAFNSYSAVALLRFTW